MYEKNKKKGGQEAAGHGRAAPTALSEWP